MASKTVEDYLKQIYLSGDLAGYGRVPMGRLADAVGVAPGTATAMVKSLARDDLVLYTPYRGVELTRRGRRLAGRMVRRHRLVERFLVEVLGMDWAEVHEEAEQLEHAISDRVMKRLDEYLGHPAVDPHGDPIPDDKGETHDELRHTLLDYAPGRRVAVRRVLDQSPRFLRSMEARGLHPGTRLRIVERDDAIDQLVVRIGRRPPITIGQGAARKLLVTPA